MDTQKAEYVKGKRKKGDNKTRKKEKKRAERRTEPVDNVLTDKMTSSFKFVVGVIYKVKN
jgi:hypothetical protein